MQRCGQVHGEAVADGRGQHHEHSSGLGTTGPARGHADRHDSGEPDSDAENLERPGCRSHEDGRDEGGEDRHATVEEARHGRVDVLLRQWEERERDRDPDHRHGEDPRPVRGIDAGAASARRSHHPEDDRTQADPSEGDHRRSQTLEGIRDEQERRAPDERDPQEQRPVVRSEFFGVLGLGGSEQSLLAGGHRRSLPAQAKWPLTNSWTDDRSRRP